MCSCVRSTDNQIINSTVKSSDSIVQSDATNLKTVVVDSCEYLQYRTYGGYCAVTHKGNCKYCAERARRANQIRISL